MAIIRLSCNACSSSPRSVWQPAMLSFLAGMSIRRGAAHGLAGMVKGLNIRALNEYGILQALQKGLDDKVGCC